MPMKRPPLGEISAREFLRRYWQKRPLLVRAALNDVERMFCTDELLTLASRDDVESRLVMRRANRWSVRHGPFRPRDLSKLPAKNWTLLVQGVENFLPAGRALLSRFDFIPYARQDDLMVSLAPPGGGVGPHFDSYDVFLLQSQGKRRWRIGAQSDLALIADAPIKLLRRFRPEREIEVAPGDLLYLPPHYAHDGIADTQCMTCSIGFRAPSMQDLATSFLQWLQDEPRPDERYRDPDLETQAHPAEISAAMLARVERMLAHVRWDRDAVARFLGEYLTEPKPQIWFDTSGRTLTQPAFLARARRDGIRLALKTRMLFRGRHLYVNGEAIEVPEPALQVMRELADRREVLPWKYRSAWAHQRLYDWYLCGYVDLV